MKKGLILLIGLVILVALLLTGCAESTLSTSGQAYPNTQGLTSLQVGDGYQQTGIWVSGIGKVKAVPDVAIIQLGVESQEKTVKEAQSKASQAMTDVVAALKNNGVATKDIQTQMYNILPVTKWIEDTEEQITIGYKVSNMVIAKIRNISQAGSIIDAVTEAGGDLTRISSISFTVDEPTPYYNQAREKAMNDAKAKAEQMASLGGITLGKITYISESGVYIPEIYPPIYKDSISAGDYATTPISEGETEIILSVQVAYAIQ